VNHLPGAVADVSRAGLCEEQSDCGVASCIIWREPRISDMLWFDWCVNFRRILYRANDCYLGAVVRAGRLRISTTAFIFKRLFRLIEIKWRMLFVDEAKPINLVVTSLII
jgi:hypothetical protein